MTAEEMKARKISLGLTTEEIAEISHIPLGTLQKIFSGVTKAPRRATIEALEQALFLAESEKKQRQLLRISYPDQLSTDLSIPGEPDLVYGSTAENERKKTIKDYYALPDTRRVELIDGKFYDMSSPSMKHQLILGELYSLFRECIIQHDMPCRIFSRTSTARIDS